MRASHAKAENSSLNYRHVVRVEGADMDVETLLHHVEDSIGGHWASAKEMRAAVDYIDGKPSVLEFHPEFYVTAGFAMTDYAVTRGPRRATLLFDESWYRHDLVRLLAAFHPHVTIDAIVLDKRAEPDEASVASFEHGYLVGHGWRMTTDAAFTRRVLASLSDPRWLGGGCTRTAPLLDVAFLEAQENLAHVRCRGTRDDVREFREDIFEGFSLGATCYVENWSDIDLLVHLRRAKGADVVARHWSRRSPSLEFDLVRTRPTGVRTHERFVRGICVAEATIALKDDLRDDLFAHRDTKLHRWPE